MGYMEGLSSLISSVLTAVNSRTILVLGVGWAILQHVYPIRFYNCLKFVTTENIVDQIYRLHIIYYNKTCLAVFACLYFTGVAQDSEMSTTTNVTLFFSCNHYFIIIFLIFIQ